MILKVAQPKRRSLFYFSIWKTRTKLVHSAIRALPQDTSPDCSQPNHNTMIQFFILILISQLLLASVVAFDEVRWRYLTPSTNGLPTVSTHFFFFFLRSTSSPTAHSVPTEATWPFPTTESLAPPSLACNIKTIFAPRFPMTVVTSLPMAECDPTASSMWPLIVVVNAPFVQMDLES